MIKQETTYKAICDACLVDLGRTMTTRADALTVPSRSGWKVVHVDATHTVLVCEGCFDRLMLLVAKGVVPWRPHVDESTCYHPSVNPDSGRVQYLCDLKAGHEGAHSIGRAKEQIPF